MLINIVCIAALVIVTIISLRRQQSTSQDKWLDETKKYSFDGLFEYVKFKLNDMTKTNIQSMGLSKERYEREIFKRSELITSLRRCVYGSLKDKQYVNDVIYTVLKDSYVSSENIDQFLPFNHLGRLSTVDKFDIVLYYYKKRYGVEGFSELVKAYKLDQPKPSEDSGKQHYEIDEEDINKIFSMEDIALSFDDQLKILAQRIYQNYKGFSVIDELRDMQIDGVSGGVSGILDASENMTGIVSSFKKVPYNYDSIWVFYQGKSIYLSCISFGSLSELKRVCQNIYRYNNKGMLSQSKGYKINDMIDGSRVVVVRPDFSESWAFFVRKFNLSQTSLEQLIRDDGAELPIGMIKYLAKGGRVTALTGSQGSGKTTLLMAMVGSIYGTLTLRIQEMAFELNLRKLYPTRNILSFKETNHISGQVGLDVQKKTDGSVNILGEVATDEVAAWMIQMSQVASLFTLFTHHAKTTKDLVLSLRNSLLKCDVFRNESISEQQVVNVLDFDVHLNRDINGKRYIERITEIIAVEKEALPEEFLDKQGEEMTRAFYQTITTYFKQVVSEEQFKTVDILAFENGAYVAKTRPSKVQLDAMVAMMDSEDAAEFKHFVLRHWGGVDVDTLSA